MVRWDRLKGDQDRNKVAVGKPGSNPIKDQTDSKKEGRLPSPNGWASKEARDSSPSKESWQFHSRDRIHPCWPNLCFFSKPLLCQPLLTGGSSQQLEFHLPGNQYYSPRASPAFITLSFQPCQLLLDWLPTLPLTTAPSLHMLAACPTQLTTDHSH